MPLRCCAVAAAHASVAVQTVVIEARTCTGRLGPSAARAAAMSDAQSRPTTSALQPPISSSLPAPAKRGASAQAGRLLAHYEDQSSCWGFASCTP